MNETYFILPDGGSWKKLFVKRVSNIGGKTVSVSAELAHAAPDLLAACEAVALFTERQKAWLIGESCTSEEYEAVMKPAFALIAKAKGEQP